MVLFSYLKESMQLEFLDFLNCNGTNSFETFPSLFVEINNLKEFVTFRVTSAFLMCTMTDSYNSIIALKQAAI